MAAEKRQASDNEPGSDGDAVPSGPGPSKKVKTAPAQQSKHRGRQGLVTFEMGDSYYKDLYKTDPDFKQLAMQDQDFAAMLKPNTAQLNFTDPAAVKQLTKTLLKADFGLDIELPDDRLCPPVPNRHNYILWLKGLLDSSSYDEPGGKLTGLDIGTGSSCIYPLLGCAQRPWYFIATDIDAKNLENAKRNVELNDLQSRIRIVPREATDALIPLDELGFESIDFVMTNPPFYHSEEDLLSSARNKSRPPHSACTGAPVEMVCPGGEVGFVSRILQESLALRGRVRWYTTMLGKASSLEDLVSRLREEGIDNYAVKQLVQGSKTRRWAVAWSFGAMRPAEDVARGMRFMPGRRVFPASSEAAVAMLPVPAAEEGGPAAAARDAQALLLPLVEGLDTLSWTWDQEALRGVGRFRENVWSRAWRRRKMREEQEGQVVPTAERAGPETCVFGFCVWVKMLPRDAMVKCRWCEGHDETLFVSFWGFLKTRMLHASMSNNP